MSRCDRRSARRRAGDAQEARRECTRMLRVVCSRRSAGLLQRYPSSPFSLNVPPRHLLSFLCTHNQQRCHVNEVSHHLWRCNTTLPTRLPIRKYTTQPQSPIPPLRWEVESTPAANSPASSSSDSQQHNDRDLFFAQDPSEAEANFVLAVSEGERDKVADYVEKHGLETQDMYGYTPLYWAAIRKQVDLVSLLLSMGADPNGLTKDLVTPLFGAAQKGCVKCIQLLIEKGASIEVRDPVGYTALHYAARHGTEEAVITLVHKYKMDVNAESHQRRTPLHEATGHHNIEAALITLGAKLDASDKNGLTPLHYASAQEGVSVKEFLKARANMEVLDHGGATPIFYAANSKNMQALRELCEGGANVDHVAAKNSKTPLMYAAASGFTEGIEMLLRFGAKLDAGTVEGDTALSCAITGSHVDAVRLLLQKGCKTDLMRKDKASPLLLAVFTDKEVELVRELVTSGVHVDGTVRGRPLHAAVSMKKMEVVEELVKLGADVNAKDLRGENALSYAVNIQDAQVVSWLITKGADVNTTNRLMATPLHMVQTAECVEVLIKAGAKFHELDWMGVTPLHVASAKSNLEVVRKLVELGADVNFVSENKRVGSPLQAAAMEAPKPTETINTLVELGANVNLPNTGNLTPIFWAASAEAVEALVDAGASVNEQKNGLGPLVQAISDKRTSVVRALLQRGADVHETTSELFSPIVYASPYPEMIHLLLEFGADLNRRYTPVEGTLLHLVARLTTDVALLPKLVPSAGVDVKDKLGRTPLYFAFVGKRQEAVVKLLEMGASVDVAVEAAQAQGEKDVVEQLKLLQEHIRYREEY